MSRREGGDNNAGEVDAACISKRSAAFDRRAGCVGSSGSRRLAGYQLGRLEMEGYWFMGDKRNTWPQKGEDWVLRRIVGSEERRTEWAGWEDQGAEPAEMDIVCRYGREVEQFRERLLVLIYIGSSPWEDIEIPGVTSSERASVVFMGREGSGRRGLNGRDRAE